MAPNLREEVTDELLMVRFQGGDASAFATLVRRYKASIYTFALRQVRSASVAEDLAQDVFMKIVQRASEFKHEARFSTWAYTIARNLCIDHLRKMSHRSHPSLDQPLRPDDDRPLCERVSDRRPDTSAERAAIGNELSARIQHAIDDLPPEQREVFLLREIGRLPFAEIAMATGISENTVKSRMRYALERLQAALSEYEDYARALQ